MYMKAIMYGAGSIGRGFIGALFSKIGYEVVFVDVNDSVVDTINREKTYPQVIANETQDINWITNIRAVNGKDADAVSDEIANADILATSVGAAVLKIIAPVIAQGLIKRWDKNPNSTFDILICENLMDADVLLCQYLLDALPETYHAMMEANLGIVETSIGRMVPPALPGSASIHPLAVRVEAYDFLPVDQAAFKGEIPKGDKIIPYSPFHYYLERKLYIHNMAHVTTAYLGKFAGLTYVHEAAKLLPIRMIVSECMAESAMALSKKYNIDYVELKQHMDDLLVRFKNPYLKDTLERVARDPVRKLQPSDRLVGAARNCEEMGIAPIYLAFSIALALYYLEDTDVPAFLEDTCKISKDEELFSHVLYFYDQLVNGLSSLDDIIFMIDERRSSVQGSII